MNKQNDAPLFLFGYKIQESASINNAAKHAPVIGPKTGIQA